MSSALPWSETFAVGHETIDRQHRGLVDAINEIDGAIRAEDHARVPHLLSALRSAAEAHFREENAILWQLLTGTYKRRSSKARPRRRGALTDAAFERHTGDHASLLLGLDNIAREPVASMVDRLRFWFVDHVTGQDAQLRPLFEAIER
jgi:hemerythrin